VSVPVVTALRTAGSARVRVELDGAPWRTLPLEPVLRAGLRAGSTLDRERARRLRRELRRGEALVAAARALRGRDLSEARLRERLERRGIAAAPREDAVLALTRAGLVDDRRVALARAAALAERGYGDAAIRWDLECQGLPPALAVEAIATLDSEAGRAARICRSRGSGPATARWLARRGFGEEAVGAAAAEEIADGA
jgi:SOS response regulatory protein OraA/RecX